MPRTRTIPDETLLEAALDIVHRSGPAALSFATLAAPVGLAASTIVQRFGSKANLLRAALLHAWDRLDADTSVAIADASLDAAGVVGMLVALTGQYEANDFADQLLVLREDLRDPVLRSRGEAWIGVLADAIEERLTGAARKSDGLGELVVAHWQGTLTVWSFTRTGPLQTVVRRSLETLLEHVLDPANAPRATAKTASVTTDVPAAQSPVSGPRATSARRAPPAVDTTGEGLRSLLLGRGWDDRRPATRAGDPDTGSAPVFVSSTLSELADERVAVSRAISALRLTPVMFELGARPHPPQDLYRAYLAQSDIFIGLYWQPYGWVGPGMDVSGLEDELRLSSSIPRLMYIKAPAPDREPRLAAMIESLQSEGTDSYRSFRTARELGRLVRDDMATLLSERFASAVGHADRVTGSVANEARRGPRSLPSTSTSLIGRQRDIVKVAKLIALPDVRLVTLTGPGGIGKTRLAIAVAEHLDRHDPRPTVFIPLAPIDEPEMVLPRIAIAVGASIEGTRRPRDALIEHFADTPTLLVLDNLEQVIGVAPTLDQLLSSCSGLKMLATSRTALRLRAEREYPVDAFLVPEFAERPTVEQLASLPAVQLFVDRAMAVRYDFTLTEDNALAVAEICRRLDGLPLAIELAAARTRLLDPVALLTRLERVLDALGTGPVDLPERQRTLRATVEWSIGLLDDPQQQLLAILAVFVDGWSVPAATHVSEHTEERVFDLLDALVGHSLVSVLATAAGPRFRMLTTVRELANERLVGRGDHDAVARRHAEYFGSLVENADWPAERQAEWADRLHTDEENVRLAVRWFFTHDRTPLPHIFRVLYFYWQMRDRMAEGRAWVDELRRSADEFDDHARAELLFTWAVTATEVGDDESALAAIEGVERVTGRIDDPYLADALSLAVAWTLPIVGDFEGALAAADAALAGFRRRDEQCVALAALTVGMLQMTLGRDDLAGTLLTEVEQLCRRLGNDLLESSARTQLAIVAVRAGHLDAARTLLSEVVGGSTATPPITLTTTFTLVAFAHLALADGATRRAATALGAADGLRRRAGLRAWPLARQTELELIARVRQLTDPRTYEQAFALGTDLHLRGTLALVAGEDSDDEGSRGA